MRPVWAASLLVIWAGTGSSEGITVDLPGGARMAMVWIEPGSFVMGSPDAEPGRDADEGPQHEVAISKGFYLGRYEITQGQWQAVTGKRPWLGLAHGQAVPAAPATYISWHDVQGFIAALNEAAGEPLYRLPTEAEWEYACRAGTTTRWSFGEGEGELVEYAWSFDNIWGTAEHSPRAAGTRRPNPWGLYDMHGNTWEWCQDRAGPYPADPQVDPAGSAGGSVFRVARGGAYNSYLEATRSANRDYGLPQNRYSIIGARLVRMGPKIGTAVAPESWGEVKDRVRRGFVAPLPIPRSPAE